MSADEKIPAPPGPGTAAPAEAAPPGGLGQRLLLLNSRRMAPEARSR